MGIDLMKAYSAKSERQSSRGFTLIASLLLLMMLSGIAIGLMMMVNTEGKVGGTDLQNNLAYHAAEGGIEKMYSDLAATFQNAQSPTATQICNVGASTNEPSMVGITFTQYSVMPGTTQQSTCPTSLTHQWGQIVSGPDQNLWAQVIPVNMLVTAADSGGQEVSMARTAQVALIPVFQFGVFSESDLSFYSGPNFDMVGRVHTNADLYPFVGPGSTLTFHNKVEAFGNVVRTQLANGWNTATNYNGGVWVPTANNGCTALTGAGNCTEMDPPGSSGSSSDYADGSVTGAGSSSEQSSGTYNTSPWNTFSKTTSNYMLINGNYGATGGSYPAGTGAKRLSMPFVSGTTLPYQIIRRALSSDSTALSESREYNLAVIHVLLDDDPADLPGGASDANNIRLANVATSNPYGIATSYPSGTNSYVPTALPAPGSSTYNVYFAAASNAIPNEVNCTSGGVPAACPTANTDSTIPNDWPYGPLPFPGESASQGLQPAGAPILTGAGGSGTASPTIWLCPPPNVSAANLPAGCSSTAAAYPYYSATSTATWNLIDGYLRVEYLNNSGAWTGVTQEWLNLGFARGMTPPTANEAGLPAGGTSNPINPNAILLLQEPADRRGNGVVNLPNDHVGIAPVCNHVASGVCTQWSNPLPPEVTADNLFPTPPSASINPWFGLTSSATATQSASMYNWYPINFYDAREGEVRDTAVTDNSCTTNGVMNAVEIDVGNLQKWLTGAIGSSGTSVNSSNQNGYVLYFSDRRGMLLNPNAPPPSAINTKSGDSGLEDVINSTYTGDNAGVGTPDGHLEPIPTGRTLSPEDVNQNGVLDNFGAANLGLGFYGTQGSATKNLNTQINSTAHPDPYGTAANARIASCSNTGRKNWVSGARHVLRLVDASLGNLPLAPSGTLSDPGGFTVASENPVYIWGDYNTNPTDTAWNNPSVDILGHSSAAVIADAVTFLSDNWVDLPSFGIGGDGTVTNPNNRVASANAYYRLAIAGGKNINFPQPTFTGVGQDFGTDGGVHNFLRYLENWNSTLNYMGSIVSLYYATYGTGIYKCCNVVYNPPTRNYIFDLDFTNPSELPPGTPMFRDVESLSYRQMFVPRTSGQ